ncbi:hypothetical protein [Flavilitoribacter nigricans]|uniref:Uncharacterized protein n=1 Tax=Flavilitoribacter nigricans (strain ATCC 23147 / DSM 23189 / NBRC 102662 / NCIMB 1420 / SS-2) TaxID=1122177 RepID=A0A2D0N4M8_FLAN2|nr:hypothetical protein [Flavilitoribacter nigricans]PHN03445.1 hypothetical protein CRP01_27580 [Flavilitoribacter nigricans DSM 23189 = NBRC 102662]
MKKFKKAYQLVITPLIVTALIGILLAWLKTSKFPEWEIEIVFICILIGVVVRLILVTEENREISERVYYLLKSINVEDNFNELAIILGLKSMAKYQGDQIEVSREDVLIFWYESVSRVRSSLDVVTFAKPSETWELGWNKRAQGIQQERIAHDCKIERVFVLNNNDLESDYEVIFREQEEIGITVYWVREEILAANQLIKQYLNEIGTKDFAIVDRRWILRTFLEKRNRKISKADATKNREILRKATLVFDEAKKNSTRYTG